MKSIHGTINSVKNLTKLPPNTTVKLSVFNTFISLKQNGRQYTILVGYKEYNNVVGLPFDYSLEYDENASKNRSSCYFLCATVESNGKVLFDNQNFLKIPFVNGDLVGVNERARHHLEVYVA